MQFNTSVGVANSSIELIYLVTTVIIMRAFMTAAGFAARQELYRKGKLPARETQSLGFLPGLMPVTGRRRIAIWTLGGIAVVLSHAAQIITLSGVNRVEKLGDDVIYANATFLWNEPGKDSHEFKPWSVQSRHRRSKTKLGARSCGPEVACAMAPVHQPQDCDVTEGCCEDIAYTCWSHSPSPAGSISPSASVSSEFPGVITAMPEATLVEDDPSISMSPQVTVSPVEFPNPVGERSGIGVQLLAGIFDDCVRYSGVRSRYLRRYTRRVENGLEMFCSDTPEYTADNEWEMEVEFEGVQKRGVLPCRTEIDSDVLQNPERAAFYDARSRVRVEHSGEGIEVAVPFFSKTGTICPSETAEYNIMTFKFRNPQAGELLLRALSETSYLAESTAAFRPGALMQRTSQIMREFLVEEQVRLRTGEYVVEIEPYSVVTLIVTCFVAVASAVISLLLRNERINTYNGLSAHCEHEVTSGGDCEYPKGNTEYRVIRRNGGQHIGFSAEYEPEPRNRGLQLCTKNVPQEEEMYEADETRQSR